MELFIHNHLPPRIQQVMIALANHKNNSKPTQPLSGWHGNAKIKLRLLQETVGIENPKCYEYTVLRTSLLKSLFAEHAKHLGHSLKSLRFTFNEKILFMSQLRKKTLKDLGKSILFSCL